MLQGVPRANKNSAAAHRNEASPAARCYRRPAVPPPSARQLPSPIQVRRKHDGKPVYLSSPTTITVDPERRRGPISVVPSIHPAGNPLPPPPPSFRSREAMAPRQPYGWCKNVAMLVFGIIILFVVFAAVIAIFPIDKNHESVPDHHDDDSDKDGRSLTPFPAQSKDGSCPPGFRPYFSGCILNMPYPRAVDDTIKDPEASPCRSLDAYACGGWRKYDRDRGSRSFRSAGRWNERLAEYVRKVNGLRETFSWDGGGGEEEEEAFFHLLTKSCVRSLLPSAESPPTMETSPTLRSLLDGLDSAGSGEDRRSVGVMTGMLAARGIPSVIHVEPVRNPTDRSLVAMYMEPWVTIGSDPHYVREILQGDDNDKLRAHMALVERSCAVLASLGRIGANRVGECAKAALSIEAALVGSVQRIPESGSAAGRHSPIPNGEQAMAQAVDANEYRSGFADGFYDALVEKLALSEAEGRVVRRASIWTLGGLEPFFEGALGALLDSEDPSNWRHYFRVIVVSEASHYLPAAGGAERVKALLAGMDRRSSSSSSSSETLVQDYLMPWGRLRRTEPLRGHVTDHARDFSPAARGGMIVPYETTRDPFIEESEVWKSCLNVAAAYLPEIADDTFSDLVVSDQDRRILEEIAGNVLRSLVDSVSASRRLSSEAKRRISSKGRSIIRRVARPWKKRPPPHAGLRLLGENFFDDAMAVRAWNARESFRAILFAAAGANPAELPSSGGSPHRQHHAGTGASPFEDPRFARGNTRRFEMPAKIPNAFFDPTQNTITILPGIMRPPFFDRRYSNASLYGTIGAVIGHELCVSPSPSPAPPSNSPPPPDVTPSTTMGSTTIFTGTWPPTGCPKPTEKPTRTPRCVTCASTTDARLPTGTRKTET